MGVIPISKKEKENSKPFTLIFILKRGGKKIEKDSIDFYPRNPDKKHIMKTIKNKFHEILQKEV